MNKILFATGVIGLLMLIRPPMIHTAMGASTHVGYPLWLFDKMPEGTSVNMGMLAFQGVVLLVFAVAISDGKKKF